MRDTETVVTRKTPTATASVSVTRPSPVPASKVRLSPLQKLTRAHLAIDARPAMARELAAATARVASKLGAQLKTSLSCTATLLPATLHPFSHLAARALFVILDCGGESLVVAELDLLTAGALLHRLGGAKDVMGPPSRLTAIEEAALGWLLLSALADLRAEKALAPFAPRLVAVTFDRTEVLRQLDARRRHLAVQLDLVLGEAACQARLLVPALWAQSKLETLPAEPLPALRDEVGAATLPATCIVGASLLPRVEAESLVAGDVVFIGGLSHQAFGLAGPGRLVTPSFELRGSFTEAGFTLTRASERPTQESPMSQIDPSVPVEVEIELARLRLPLHQLGTVKPGSVLPLHINAAQQVIVRIGDKAVARAELVEVEGEIGARIISML